MEDILKNIEAIRKEKGIKQAVIAEMLGVGQSAYSNYVNRNNDIPYSRLSQIANILQVSTVDIITHPVKYVPETDKCSSCKEKDLIIKNLNEYMEILKEKINNKK